MVGLLRPRGRWTRILGLGVLRSGAGLASAVLIALFWACWRRLFCRRRRWLAWSCWSPLLFLVWPTILGFHCIVGHVRACCSLRGRDTLERVGLIDVALPVVLLDLFLELDKLVLDFGIDVPLLLA